MSVNKPSSLPTSTAVITQPSPTARDLTASAHNYQFSSLPRPLTYTFYHPTHTHAPPNLPTAKNHERKQYRYVSHSFNGNKHVENRSASNHTQKPQRNDAGSRNYGCRVVAAGEQPKAKEQNVYYTLSPAAGSSFAVDNVSKDYSRLRVKKVSSYEEIKQLLTQQPLDSRCDEGETLPKARQFQWGHDKSATKHPHQQNDATVRYCGQVVQLPYQELMKFCQKCQTELQLLQSQYHCKQVASWNQSTMASEEHRYQVLLRERDQLQQKISKNEESLKISRNIIATLNHKIAYTAKDHEDDLKGLQERHQTQLADLRHSHEEAAKVLQSTIFELKLKLIDQTNAMEDALVRAEQQFKLQAQAEMQQLQQQLFEAANAKQLSQHEARRLSQVVAVLQSDLLKLDQQNMRMDQQICRLLHIDRQNAELLAANHTLKLQNVHIVAQIGRLNCFLEQLGLENAQLKQQLDHPENTTSPALQRQAAALQLQVAQNRTLVGNLHQLQGEIKVLRGSIEQMEKEMGVIQGQRQTLLQQLQQKEGQIGRLNITKGSLMLQNLKLKEKLKKKQASPILSSCQQTHPDELSRLNDEIGHMKSQLDVYKEWLERKEDSLRQKQSLQLGLIDQLKNRDHQIQILSTMLARKDAESGEQQQFEHSTIEEYLEIPTGGSQVDRYQQERYVVFGRCELQQWKLKYWQLKVQSERSNQKNAALQTQIMALQLKITQYCSRIQDLQIHIQVGKKEVQAIVECNQQQTQTSQQHYAQRLPSQIQPSSQPIYPQIMEQAGQSPSLAHNHQSQLASGSTAQQQIAQLQVQLSHANQIIQHQKITIDELNRELEVQEKDYRTMVEEEINKITMIYSEDTPDLDSPLKNNPHPLHFTTPHDSILEQDFEDSPRSNDTDEFEDLGRDELIDKARELSFVNKSLLIKVQEINKMEETLSEVIVVRLRKFEVSLERSEQEKQELEARVFQLVEDLQLMAANCRTYQARIECVEKGYKEVEGNLAETTEELIRAQLAHCNFKLQLRSQNEGENSHPPAQIQIGALQIATTQTEEQPPKYTRIQELDIVDKMLDGEIETLVTHLAPAASGQLKSTNSYDTVSSHSHDSVSCYPGVVHLPHQNNISNYIMRIIHNLDQRDVHNPNERDIHNRNQRDSSPPHSHKCQPEWGTGAEVGHPSDMLGQTAQARDMLQSDMLEQIGQPLEMLQQQIGRPQLGVPSENYQF